MCTNTLSVAWDGRLYDCDFNQQLQMGMSPSSSTAAAAAAAAAADSTSTSDNDQQQQQQQGPKSLTVWDLDSLDDLTGRGVRVGSHCYGCTAGSGSGCQGATV
jgi:ABC-type enterochelin transport system substrate-binding protein